MKKAHQKKHQQSVCSYSPQISWGRNLDSPSFSMSCSLLDSVFCRTITEECWVYPLEVQLVSDQFQTPHLRTIVNLESGKGWERNMKRERKSETKKTTLCWTRLPGRKTSQWSQKNIKDVWLKDVQTRAGCLVFCGSYW